MVQMPPWCAWLLLLTLSSLQTVAGEIEIFTEGNRLSVTDVPASFGPRIGEEGIKGLLVGASPDVFGCHPLQLNTSASGTFVLIQRSPLDTQAADVQHCSFEVKVRHAQAAGATLAIVYDSEDGPLVRMKAEDPSGIHIPSIFISQQSGLALLQMAAAAPFPGLLAYVDDEEAFPDFFTSLNLTMLGLILGFLLIVLVCGTLFLCSSSRLRRRLPGLKAETLPMTDVLALPEVCVDPDSEHRGQACPVCLEEYGTGERLKVLPCKHAFHTDCIAPWLCERQRTCPLCKESVVASCSEPLLRRPLLSRLTSPLTLRSRSPPPLPHSPPDHLTRQEEGRARAVGGSEDEGKDEGPSTSTSTSTSTPVASTVGVAT